MGYVVSFTPRLLSRGGWGTPVTIKFEAAWAPKTDGEVCCKDKTLPRELH